MSKINEHNGAEANKDNQIKLTNLATGEYVGKGKYDALDTQYKGKETELASKSDNEAIKVKIIDLVNQIQLQESPRPIDMLPFR